MAATEPEEALPYERDADEVSRLIEDGAQLIDVRQDYEFEAGRIPGASRIGLETLAERRDAVAKDRSVVFYCRTGSRSAMAAQAFAEAGVDATSLAGGITGWLEAGKPIDPDDGYVSEPGEAAAVLEARARAATR
jgi:rhodanese-related sulfurtransferase